MNERIKELAEQAGAKFIEARLHPRGGWLSEDWDTTKLDPEKFAELIIKKCMDIVSEQTTQDTNEDFRSGFSHGRKYAWIEIRKHFGENDD